MRFEVWGRHYRYTPLHHKALYYKANFLSRVTADFSYWVAGNMGWVEIILPGSTAFGYTIYALQENSINNTAKSCWRLNILIELIL